MKKFRKIMAVLVAAMIVMSSMTLTAFAATITVTYQANGASGGTAPDAGTGNDEDGVVIVAKPDGLVNTGANFIGWNTKADGTGTTYYPGDTVKSTMTLFAMWQTPTNDDGRLEEDDAVITIANAKKGETYSAYKIFDLASFTDENTATGSHDGDEPSGNAKEHYSYVIRKHTGSTVTGETNLNPWWVFITTKGFTNASGTEIKYAYTDAPTKEAAGGMSETDFNAMAAARDEAYFTYSQEPVTLVSDDGTNSYSDYYIIKATLNFANTLDDLGNPTLNYSSRTNEGVSAGNDYVTSTNKKVQDFAQEAVKWAVEYASTAPSNSSAVTATATKTAATDGALELIKASDSKAIGYYLVKTTMGSLASLDTTNNSVTIFEKNDEPDIDKAVLVKDAGAFSTTDTDWVMNTDANIGDYVQFRTVITAEQGLGRDENGNQLWKLHDVMENGLEFVNYDYLTEYNATGTNKNTEDTTGKYGYRVVLKHGSDYYVIPSGTVTFTTEGVQHTGTNFTVNTADPADNCDFEITFQDAEENNEKPSTYDQINWLGYKLTDLTLAANTGEATVLDIKDGDEIIVYYYAKVTDKAAIWGDAETVGTSTTTTIADNKGTALPATHQVNYTHNASQRNENYTVLTYGDKGYTQLKYAAVTTYQFDIAKTRNDKNGDSDHNYELLAGAEFKIYRVQTTNPAGEETTWKLGTTDYYNQLGTKALAFKTLTGSAPDPSYADPAWVYAGDVTSNATDGDVKTGTTRNVLTSLATGVLNLNGLEEGTYLIEETKAPLGYDKLAHPIIVTIAGDANNNGEIEDDTPVEGTITTKTILNNGTSQELTNICWQAATTADGGKTFYIDNSGTKLTLPTMQLGGQTAATISESTQTLKGVQIINTTGEELPSTGGMGTTVLYIVGGMMVILAGAYLFFSKKRNAA